MPIEALLIDAPLEDGQIGTPEWFKPHRTPLLLEANGAWHLVFWVGAEFYPNVWDFIEETRVAGASRRVPSSMDFSKLTPASRMIFVHPQAKVDVTVPELYCPCPKGVHTFAGEPSCLGGAKYLPMADVEGYRTEELGEAVTRTIPCGHSYAAYAAPSWMKYAPENPRPAVFLQMAVTGIAMINDREGAFDADVERRVREARVEAFRADA